VLPTNDLPLPMARHKLNKQASLSLRILVSRSPASAVLEPLALIPRAIAVTSFGAFG
jgi:hypothetical protein